MTLISTDKLKLKQKVLFKSIRLTIYRTLSVKVLTQNLLRVFLRLLKSAIVNGSKLLLTKFVNVWARLEISEKIKFMFLTLRKQQYNLGSPRFFYHENIINF